jgi:zinc/manganese transport system substrate-binding protein
MARQVVAALAVIGVFGVAACGTSAATPTDGRIQVVTSTDVWASVVTAVGGDDVDVTAIIHNPSQDPHDYQSTPSDAAKIDKAQLALYNGNGYDDFFAADLKATPSPSRTAIVAFALSGQSTNANEHVFYDLPTVVRVADAVAAQLSRIQPAHASAFKRNAAAFDGAVNSVLASARQIGAHHPGRSVVVTEPVADYLLTAAGIRDATPPAFEHAVESDTDIPVAAINAATNLITTHQVAALINNAQTVTNVTSQLAAKARTSNVPVVNVTETLPPGVSGYLPWMTAQVKALTAAIGP